MKCREAVFILGMHRSGTSATTRLLNLLGVDLGQIPALVAEDNERGFWEHPGVVAVNEAVLAALGSRWDDPSPLPLEWWWSAAMEPHRDAIRRLVRDEFASAPLFGVKDPRLCRLVPLWVCSLAELSVTPVFVLVLRHPSEIAASVRRRNRLPEHVGEALWLIHMLEAERHTRGHRRVFVSYEDLLEHWQAQARRIAKATGLSWPKPEQQAEAEVSAFLDPALRHFRADRSAWRPGLSRWVSEAYELMAGAASGDESEEIRDGLARLQDAFAAGEAIYGPLLADGKARVRAQQQAEEFASSRETAADNVASRDEAIRALQVSLEEQTRWARETAAQVADQAAVIQELNGRLEESRRLLADATRRDEDRFRRLEQEYGHQVIEAKERFGALQQQMDELVALSRRSPLKRLREAVRSLLEGGPRIKILHPAWTEAGKGFNTQQDGGAHLATEGAGFGHGAILVVAGRPLETYHAFGRLLSARMPDELFGRPGVLPVWVDNRNGTRRLSAIRCFRVLSERTAAAYRPGLGRWGLAKGVRRRLVRFALAGSSRMRLPLFYALRRWQETGDCWQAIFNGQRRRPVVTLTPEVSAHIKPACLPRKPDLICFSIIDWDFRYQRPQQILSRLAQAGHRVFYLSQRFLRRGDETFRLRPLAAGVTEVFLQCLAAVNIYNDALQGEVEETLYTALLEFKAAAGLGETICFVHLPFWTPLALRLKADLGYRVVFDCLDNFSGFQNIRDRMLELETTLAARADLVVVSSRFLAQKHAAQDPLLVPNAADYAHFSTPKLPALRPPGPGPVLGYYGAIAHWFDAGLIAQAATARPDWRFVLIGRTAREVQAQLGGFPNIHLRDEIPYEDLPAHLAAFDVCLIPFTVDDLIKATSPVKFFEYLAAGKPVVAARMPELLPFAGECFLYEGLPEFLRQVERALPVKDDLVRVEARRAVARDNTWEARMDVLRPALQGLYPRASVIVVTYDGLEMTKACVESLLEKTAYADWELILADNNSSDGTPGYLRSLSEQHPFVRIILNDSNLGFAAANNQGIRIATGEFIVLLNNDTVVTPGWLGRLLRHLNDPSIGMVGPVTNNIGNEAQIEADYGDMAAMEAFAERYTRAHAGRVFDISMLAMFCAAMRRSLLDKVGMLDERYKIGMFEDDDFSRSVKTRGFRVICAEDVFIHHVGRGSFRKLDPEAYQRIFEANRKRYEEKWGEPWVPHRYRKTEGV